MTYTYFQKIINGKECIGNSLSTINIDLTALACGLSSLSAYTTTSINFLSSNIDSLSNVYVNISGDVMTGSLSAPILSTGTLYVAASTIFFTQDNIVVESLKSSDVLHFKNTYNSVQTLSTTWGSGGSSGATLSSNTFSGTQVIAASGSANTAALLLNGGVFTGGSGTTTKPFALLEPVGTVSTGWNTNGTMLGVNAPATFVGKLIDVQLYGSTRFSVNYDGRVTASDIRAIAGGTLFLAGNNGFGTLTLWDTYVYFQGAGCFPTGMGPKVASDGTFGFTSGTNPSNTSLDAFFSRDAAGITSQKNGTNAQTHRIYGNETGSKYLHLGHDGTNATLSASSGFVAFTQNGAASTPAVVINGSIFTGGSATTTKPQLLVEPTGTTSTGWNTNGTMLGVNAPTGFNGNLMDLQVNGTTQLKVTSNGGIIGNGFYLGYFAASNFLLNTDGAKLTMGAGQDISLGRAAANTLQYGADLGGGSYLRVMGNGYNGTKYLNLGHNGTNAIINVTSGSLLISSLPTANPGAGILWNNAGTPAIGT